MKFLNNSENFNKPEWCVQRKNNELKRSITYFLPPEGLSCGIALIDLPAA